MGVKFWEINYFRISWINGSLLDLALTLRRLSVINLNRQSSHFPFINVWQSKVAHCFHLWFSNRNYMAMGELINSVNMLVLFNQHTQTVNKSIHCRRLTPTYKPFSSYKWNWSNCQNRQCTEFQYVTTEKQPAEKKNTPKRQKFTRLNNKHKEN